ncbi:MAG: hypothetical protein ACFFBP_05395 [Promethearchaeota archaeon]
MNKKNTLKPYQSKIGPIVAMIGAILLSLGGLSVFGILGTLEILILLAGESWTSLGIDHSLLYITGGVTLFLGLGALCGAIISFKNRLIGGAICIIFGVIAIIGINIPIGVIDLSVISGGIHPIPMNGLGLYIDPFLIIIGGVLCYSLFTKLKTDEEVKAELEKRYPSYSKTH